MLKERKMGKWGWKIIALAVVAGLLFAWLIKAPIMSSYLSSHLKMDVSVGRISVGTGQMKIGNFSISNPKGYKTPTAFKAASIDALYQWKQVRGNPSVIDQILIDGIFLDIEFSNSLSTQNNWSELIRQMPKKKNGSREVIIKRLILNNMTVQIRNQGLLDSSKTQTFNQMEFTDISSKEGFPTHELIAKIFSNAGLMDTIKDVVPGGPGGIIKKLIPFTQNEKGRENPAP
jgi:hypothetical protein